MSDARITSKLRPMRHVVVAGGGPIGLFTAIKLKQMGVKSIAIIDKRLGDYSRSGDFVEEVFPTFSEALGFPVKPSYMRHIKDVERCLFQHAKKMEVTLYKCNVMTLAAGKVVIQDPTTEAGREVDCDVIFDATGTSRAIIQLANAFHPRAFLTQSKFPNFHQSYIFVRGKINGRDYNDFYTSWMSYEQQNFSGKAFEQSMEEFHALGWPTLVPPYSYPNGGKENWNNVIIATDIYKVNIYAQAPPSFRNLEHQQAWMQKILKFYIGREITSFVLAPPSKKHPEKKAISRFDVVPQVTTPNYYLDKKASIPIVFPVGDAQANLAFYTAQSVIQGIDRAAVLMKFIQVRDGEIVEIALAHYNMAVKIRMKVYDEIMDHHQAIEKNRLDKAHRQLLTQAVSDLKNIADEKTGISLTILNALTRLKESKDGFEKFLKLPDIQVAEQEAAKENLLNMAKKCKSLATHFLKLNNPHLAAKYYKMSLEIYDTHFTNLYPNDVIALYSNLLIVAHQRNDFEEGIRLGNMARHKLFPHISAAAQPIAAKITFNLISAQIKEINRCLNTAPQNRLRIEELFHNAKELIREIAENPALNYKELSIKLKLLDEQFTATTPSPEKIRLL